MPRRFLLAISLACLALLALAVVPWTISSGSITAAISAQLKTLYGLDMTVSGRRTVAFLPIPRLKFEDVTLTTADGTPILRGAQLRGEIRILPLFLGRLELSDLALNDADITVDMAGAEGNSLAPLLSRLSERVTGQTSGWSPRRVVVTESRLHLRAASTGPIEVTDINLVLSWPRVSGPLEVAGSFRWRGEAVEVKLGDIVPSALLAGNASPIVAEVKGPGLVASTKGELQVLPWLGVVGRSTLKVRSAGDLMGWAGLGAPLARQMPPLTIEGDMTLQGTTASWPTVRVTLGSDRLDGALALRVDRPRLSLTGTLAADQIDLSGFLAPLRDLRTPAGDWSTEAIDLAELTRGDLDLRLSATAAKFGAVAVDEMAASILVKSGRIEAAVGRASIGKGTLKGRMTLAGDGPRTDLRLQGSFGRLDLAPLLASLGRSRWIAGTGHGQIAIEALGESPADLARNAQGRTTITLNQGEIIGVALPEVLRRAERHPLSLGEWRGGRTPFDQASLTLNLGRGDVLEGTLAAQDLRAALQGRVFLAERLISARARVESYAAGPQPSSLSFDISGNWDSVAIIPDVRALIQRSGAAQSLLRGANDNSALDAAGAPTGQ